MPDAHLSGCSARLAPLRVSSTFTGPTSAIIGSLVVAALGAGTVALLFLPEASKRFYAA